MTALDAAVVETAGVTVVDAAVVETAGVTVVETDGVTVVDAAAVETAGVTVPDAGGSRPVITLASVDFPLPDSPTIARLVPRRSAIDTSHKTCSRP